MKKTLILSTALILLSALSPDHGRAAGFRLPDQDAAAMGLAGAFTAQADNASAVWYNPAAMTQLEGTNVSAGSVAVYPVIRHETADGTGRVDVTERSVFFPAEVFGTTRLNDRTALGLGVNSPFGLETNWYPQSATSGVATLSRIKTVNVNPDIAYKLNDRTSVAVGIDFLYLQATLERMVAPGLPFRLDGDGQGWGANAAVLYRATDDLNLGLSYRSRTKVRVRGTASVPLFGAAAQTDITLPDFAQLGASYKASDRLTLDADLEYTWWSAFDRIEISSALPVFNATEEKDWKNVWAVRVGGQYRLSDRWKLRAGMVYDKNPVPDERIETSLPDSDRQGITVGTGYSAGRMTVDASYMYLHFSTRHVTNSLAGGSTVVPELNGTYKSQAHLLALTVGYKF